MSPKDRIKFLSFLRESRDLDEHDFGTGQALNKLENFLNSSRALWDMNPEFWDTDVRRIPGLRQLILNQLRMTNVNDVISPQKIDDNEKLMDHPPAYGDLFPNP